MGVKTVQYSSQIAQDTSRGPSQGLWFDCPIDDAYQGFGGGIGTQLMLVQEDFLAAGQIPATNAAHNLGSLAVFADTNATVNTDPNQEGGVLQIGAGTNNSVGVAVGAYDGAFRLVSGASGFPLGQKLWFECRIATKSIAASVRDIFIGLCDNGPLLFNATAGLWSAADTFQTTRSFIGFNARGGATNPGDFGFVAQATGQTLQRFTNLTTLVTTVTGTAPTAYATVSNAPSTGFVKLGFTFDPTAGNTTRLIGSASTGQTAGNLAKPLVEVFVNGQLAAAFLTSTNVQAATFPATWLGPVIAWRSAAATTAGDAYIDWFRVAQLASF